MKLNKKMMAVNLLASLLMTEAAMARIQGVRTPPGGSDSTTNTPSGRPSNVVVTEGQKEDFSTVIAVNNSTCNNDSDAEKYFPMEFFSDIVRDEGAKIDIQLRPNNKVVVKVPPAINTCGAFVPELRQNKETKNLTVMMKLIGTKKETVKQPDGTEKIVETPNTLLTHKEFLECMQTQKFMVAQPGKKEKVLDFSLVEPKQYSESTYTMDFEFDKKKDVKKTVTVTYGSPKSYFHPGATGYKSLFGFDDRVSVPGEACMRSEKVASEPLYVNKGQDVLIEEINAICRTGDAQKIAEARRSLGNAEALKDIADKIKADMDAGYLAAVKTDADRIYKRMKAIEELTYKEPNMDVSKAKKLIEEYASLASELNTKLLDPAITQLASLIKRREAVEDDSAEAKNLDAEIKKLNMTIKEFHTKSNSPITYVYRQAEKYALIDDARTMEDIILKSEAYGRVYVGKNDTDGAGARGPKLTLESAQAFQTQGVQKFEKVLVDWHDKHLVSQGNMLPIQKTERERQAVIDRMNKRWADYEKKEYTDFNNYCGVGMLGSVKNPVKCNEFRSGMERRRNLELKKREKDLYYIKGRNEKLEKMGSVYNNYQRERERKMASEDAAEISRYDSASSISGYEDSFLDRFPGYFGPTTSTNYDPSQFNMGQGFMGQQQMMMQPQMQQQYYPQQQQMSGWPALR